MKRLNSGDSQTICNTYIRILYSFSKCKVQSRSKKKNKEKKNQGRRSRGIGGLESNNARTLISITHCPLIDFSEVHLLLPLSVRYASDDLPIKNDDKKKKFLQTNKQQKIRKNKMY